MKKQLTANRLNSERHSSHKRKVRNSSTELIPATPKKEMTANTDLVRQFLIARSEYLWRLMDDPRKDINEECGYPYLPTVFMYRQWYDREGIATRVVDLYPDECWAIFPSLKENDRRTKTNFEKMWEDMVDDPEINPWTYLHCVDRLSGIGAYGILLLGLDDGKELWEPVPGILEDGTADPNYKKEHQLKYLKAFDQTLVWVSAYEQDPHNPRFCQPLYYQVKFTDPLLLASSVQPSLIDYTIKTIHWTRVVHIADNRMSSKVFGVPRLQPVLNRMFDCRKILGGSGEMFWRGAVPLWAFETPPELGTNVNLDLKSVDEQMALMQNSLQRYIGLTGMRARSLAPQVSSPEPMMSEQYKAICCTIRAPMKIFLGSESGHLASGEDAKSWIRRVKGRQGNYIDPYIIRPFVNRLVLCRVLPKPNKYTVVWDDLIALSDEEKANVALKKSQAMFQYVTGKVESVLPLREYLTLYQGMTPDVADSIIAEVTKNKTLFSKKAWDNQDPGGPQGGGRTGNAGGSAGRPRATTNRKSKRS
jgi:hypothetical protein